MDCPSEPEADPLRDLELLADPERETDSTTEGHPETEPEVEKD